MNIDNLDRYCRLFVIVRPHQHIIAVTKAESSSQRPHRSASVPQEKFHWHLLLGLLYLGARLSEWPTITFDSIDLCTRGRVSGVADGHA